MCSLGKLLKICHYKFWSIFNLITLKNYSHEMDENHWMDSSLNLDSHFRIIMFNMFITGWLFS